MAGNRAPILVILSIALDDGLWYSVPTTKARGCRHPALTSLQHRRHPPAMLPYGNTAQIVCGRMAGLAELCGVALYKKGSMQAD